MKSKVNLWTIAAFMCAIAPNLIAPALCALSGLQGSSDGLWLVYAIAYLFIGFTFFPGWTLLLGMISIVLAIIAIRRRGTGGRTLAIVALILGALEIAWAGSYLAGQAYGLWP